MLPSGTIDLLPISRRSIYLKAILTDNFIALRWSAMSRQV